MPARINNMPAFAVYDLSSKQSVTTAVLCGTKTITGTPNLMIDRNLTTYYGVTSVYNSTGNPVVAQITIDYGAIYFNCQLFCDYDMHDTTADVSVSSDGTNWTTITTTNYRATFGTTLMSMRYVQFTASRPANASTALEVYECRLMGA